MKNNYFTEMCSDSEEGSYLSLIDFAYHSTLGSRVIKNKITGRHLASQKQREQRTGTGGEVHTLASFYSEVPTDKTTQSRLELAIISLRGSLGDSGSPGKIAKEAKVCRRLKCRSGSQGASKTRLF